LISLAYLYHFRCIKPEKECITLIVNELNLDMAHNDPMLDI